LEALLLRFHHGLEAVDRRLLLLELRAEVPLQVRVPPVLLRALRLPPAVQGGPQPRRPLLQVPPLRDNGFRGGGWRGDGAFRPPSRRAREGSSVVFFTGVGAGSIIESRGPAGVTAPRFFSRTGTLFLLPQKFFVVAPVTIFSLFITISADVFPAYQREVVRRSDQRFRVNGGGVRRTVPLPHWRICAIARRGWFATETTLDSGRRPGWFEGQEGGDGWIIDGNI
jgi:hypothetical protein